MKIVKNASKQLLQVMIPLPSFFPKLPLNPNIETRIAIIFEIEDEVISDPIFAKVKIFHMAGKTAHTIHGPLLLQVMSINWCLYLQLGLASLAQQFLPLQPSSHLQVSGHTARIGPLHSSPIRLLGPLLHLSRPTTLMGHLSHFRPHPAAHLLHCLLPLSVQLQQATPSSPLSAQLTQRSTPPLIWPTFIKP